MGAREMHFFVGVDNVFDQDPPGEIPLSEVAWQNWTVG